MSLADRIDLIASNIRANQYRNETDVREAIVIPILMELGWDVFSTTVVQREFSVERRRVDYALFTTPNSPSVFIEVKALNASGDGDRQLFEYAFHLGVPFAILVDGREWSFFLPGEQGSYVERRVHKLDLLERKSQESVEIFERYLRADRVKNGQAISDARSDYQSAARDREARTAIPKAWYELATEPDELLIDLIAEKVVSLIGFRPTDEHIEAFLSGLQTIVPPLASISAPASQAKPINRSEPVLNPSGTRKISFVFRGRRLEQPDAISALIFVLQDLASRDVSFIERFAKLAPGRRRNHIARDRSGVYPGKPELEVYTQDIGGGWWLGTNIANREKERLLRIACEVAGLKFGRDLQIDLPNVQG